MVAVGVAVFFVILARRVVGEDLVRLGDLDEEVVVAARLVGVVLEREPAVRLLHLRHLRALLHAEDLVRIE